MKTKHGYFEINDGSSTWYFREDAEVSTNDTLDEWDKICIFKIDNYLGSVLHTDWDHVRCVHDMITQLKREQVSEHKHLPIDNPRHHDVNTSEVLDNFLSEENKDV